MLTRPVKQDKHEEIDEKSSDYQRYVISAYAYFRSRLLVPGRCHEDEDRGTLAIGGSAHADLMDLDIWLSKQSDEVRREALDWINDSSLEITAYYRGLGRYPRRTRDSRRAKLAQKAAKDAQSE